MKNAKLFFSCGKRGDMLYCNLFLGNVLARMNIKTGEFVVLNGMNGPIGNDWWGGTDYLFCDDKLYIVSNRLNQVAEYSLSKEECNYWRIDEPTFALSCPNYSLCLLIRDKIYIFPKFDETLRIFDVNSHEIVEHRHISLDSSYSHEKNVGEVGALVSKAMQIGDDVWLFSRLKPMVWKYSLITQNIEETFELDKSSGCVDATLYNGKFYLLDEFGSVFCWDKTEQKTTLLFSTARSDGYFLRVAVTKTHIWLLPSLGDEILRYDFLSKKTEAYKDMPPDFRYTPIFNVQAKFYKGCEDERYYYFAMCAATHLLILDKTTGKAQWLRPKYQSETEVKKHLRLAHSRTKLFGENESFNLRDYLLFIEPKFKQFEESYIGVGRKIFDFAMKGVDL